MQVTAARICVTYSSMRMQRFASLRHPHLLWSQAASASVPQALVILALCICGVVLVAYLLDILIGLGFDQLPGGTR